MATSRTRNLRLVEPPPEPLPGPISVDVPPEPNLDGVLQMEHDDGSTTIDFEPEIPEPEEDPGGPTDKFFENLALKMSEDKMAEIATDLLDGIKRDDDSREEWLQTRAKGIQLLGLRLEDPKSDVGRSSAPLEGMSTVRHPMLLDSTVQFQATAGGELLPAAGPVKIRNDSPPPTKEAIAAKQADNTSTDELAQALERDMNHYLTAVATEYYPDTDRMLFYIGFGGDGFKKVYNCPLRRRPVSESVDAENLIVSNAATDMKNCARITHKIMMRKSIIRRMQILGAYRDVDLSPPSPPTPNAVEAEQQDIQGQQRLAQRPEDYDYTIYECYCELDLDEYAPKQFKGKGLALPYRVTIEKDSRQVLSIMRNWREEDDQCLAKQFFVQFPFIRGLGFYGLGFIHLVGNTTTALTGAWREMLDAGMFANFPAFIYLKGLGRQLTNQFRAGPGQGIPLEGNGMGDIRQMVMPMPYKSPDAGFMAFVKQIEEGGMRLAATSQISVGEGKQDAPVGTTLALIEQATKLISNVHKRLHAAQGEEFKLLKERFREDPESFWRHNRKPAVPWKKEQFLEALENHELVPVADPNNPTSLHRISKATVMKTLQQMSPRLYDGKAIDERIYRIVGIDPEGLFLPTPAPEPPDPRLVAIQQKAAAAQAQTQYQMQDAILKAKLQVAQLQEKAADRESRERLQQYKLMIEEMETFQSTLIHAEESQHEEARAMREEMMERLRAIREMEIDSLERARDLELKDMERTEEIRQRIREQQQRLEAQHGKHSLTLQAQKEKHQMKLEQDRELHEQKLEQAKALAKQAKKDKPKPKKGD